MRISLCDIKLFVIHAQLLAPNLPFHWNVLKGTLSQIFSGEYQEIYKNIYFEELEAAMRGVAQEKVFFQISQNSQETPGSRVSI